MGLVNVMARNKGLGDLNISSLSIVKSFSKKVSREKVEGERKRRKKYVFFLTNDILPRSTMTRFVVRCHQVRER